MCPSEKINQATRDEWRDLGFYYEQDDSRWIFIWIKIRNIEISGFIKSIYSKCS